MGNNLRKEALSLLERLRLLKFLEKYGKVYIVGSVELDVMTWRDIDLEVLSDRIPSREDAMEIASYLFGFAGVRKVSTIDYRNITHPKKPKGLYIGTECVEADGSKWKIDVWNLTPDSANSKEYTQKLRAKINSSARKIIVEIKSQICNHPKYRKEVQSVDIYDAVLEKGVTNMPEFEKYLSDKDIFL